MDRLDTKFPLVISESNFTWEKSVKEYPNLFHAVLIILTLKNKANNGQVLFNKVCFSNVLTKPDK